MNVFINGNEITIEPTIEQDLTGANNSNERNQEIVIKTALALFLSNDQQDRTYAVALNGHFIGRGDYARTRIKEGDSIDVLFPIQGG